VGHKLYVCDSLNFWRCPVIEIFDRDDAGRQYHGFENVNCHFHTGCSVVL